MIFALTGPSGSGKTTYAKMLLEEYSDTAVSSHTVTTRLPRKGKDENKQYTFVTKEEFKLMAKNKEFACWIEFCANFYGIKKSFIQNVIDSGKILILDSIQHPDKVLKLHPKAVVVYLSVAKQDSESRIRSRGEVNENEIALRMADYDRQEKLKHFCTLELNAGNDLTEKQVFNKLISIFEQFCKDVL